MIFAPMAHAVHPAIILIHPIFKARKAGFDFFLIFFQEAMAVFQIEADHGIGSKIGAVFPHIDALNGTLQIGADEGCILEIGIFQGFRFIQHFVQLAVAALGQLRFIHFDEQKIVAKLQHHTAQKQHCHQQNQPFHAFFHRFLLPKQFIFTILAYFLIWRNTAFSISPNY